MLTVNNKNLRLLKYKNALKRPYLRLKQYKYYLKINLLKAKDFRGL
jgi:hypothetical protein